MSPIVVAPPLARRIALAAQGFGRSRPATPGARDLLRCLDRLNLFQIDSVNVLSRAHYLPAFSRLGSYDRALLDRLAWGRKAERRLFEYWAHEASLLPLHLHPLLRWRMARADRGEVGYGSVRAHAGERRRHALALLDRIRGEGPLAASQVEGGRGRPGWWEWGEGKRALEWLFWAGHVTTATRRGAFERVYDVPERVVPAAVLALPTPDPAAAHRTLVRLAARALGIATAADLRDYFRLDPAETRAAIGALAAEGALLPAAVPGWGQPAWLDPEARRPRRIEGHALLAPFDPLVWNRARTERLFGFRYRIEIYVPAPARRHGYYVLPFLLDGRLVARIDLKADRAGGRLLVQGWSAEPDAPPGTAPRLAGAVREMADWLGLAAADALRAERPAAPRAAVLPAGGEDGG